MWAELAKRPSHTAVLVLCAAIVIVHQVVHREFFIDDAAICFAYARNIADGHGVVPWPGGERIEGISDPTWVALLALFELVGLDGFLVAKPLSLLFSVLTIPVVYRITLLAMPGNPGPAPLFGPMMLAASAQLAIWGASGLENALWVFLVAWAILRTVLDAQRGRFLGSALLWLLVTWSRPEGLVYASCGAFWYLVFLARRGASMRPFGAWLAVFWLPTFALELLRIWYFAWPVSNTWYAKVDTRPSFHWSWNDRGWMQLRDFSKRLWQGYYLPLYPIGLLGLAGRRGRLALTVLIVMGLALLYPPPDHIGALAFWPALPAPKGDWLAFRIGLIAFTLVALPFGAIGKPGYEARVLCWHTVAIGILFSVYANGDWMGAYRWMSLVLPGMAVLFAVGVGEVLDWFEFRLGAFGLSAGTGEWGSASWLIAAFVVCGLIPPNIAQTKDHLGFNADETAARIALRAEFTQSIVQKTFYEGPLRNLEMDMGGYLWHRPDLRQVDMAGLIDIPMSRHTYQQRSFIEEYVFEENLPTFGHVHSWWANYSGFKTYPQWEDYVELPVYEDLPPAPLEHDGMWAHRSMFVTDSWTGPDRRAVFTEPSETGGAGLAMRGFDVPAEIWPRGGDGFIEIAMSSGPRGLEDLPRLVAFLSDGTEVLASWDLPLGYGLFAPDEWRSDVLIGRYAVKVPASVPAGRYELGFVALSSGGEVMQASQAPGTRIGGQDGVAPVLAYGEVRFPRTIKVGATVDVEALAGMVRDEAVTIAATGHCEKAEAKWIASKRVRPRAWWWHDDARERVSEPFAECYVGRAAADPARAPAWLARAHDWDHDNAVLLEAGDVVGNNLWAVGKTARATEDWDEAYQAYTALLSFQPWRSWARRYAEEARDHRLGLRREAPTYAPSVPEGDEGVLSPEVTGPAD